MRVASVFFPCSCPARSLCPLEPRWWYSSTLLSDKNRRVYLGRRKVYGSIFFYSGYFTSMSSRRIENAFDVFPFRKPQSIGTTWRATLPIRGKTNTLPSGRRAKNSAVLCLWALAVQCLLIRCAMTFDALDWYQWCNSNRRLCMRSSLGISHLSWMDFLTAEEAKEIKIGPKAKNSQV